MIKLTIAGKEMLLGKSTALTFEVLSDFLNFEELEGTWSYTFNLPAEGENLLVWKMPHFPESSYFPWPEEEFELEYMGLTLFTGSALLKKADRKHLKVFCQAAVSPLGKHANTHIKNLVSGNYTFLTTDVAQLHTHYADHAEVCFPPIAIDGRLFNMHDGSTYTGDVVPCFKLKYIIDELFTQLGYSVSWAFDVASKGLDEVFITNAQQWKPAEGATSPLTMHFPNLSLKNFHRSLRVSFALFPVFDHLSKKLTVYWLGDIVDKLPEIDLTDRAVPVPETEDDAYEGVTFSLVDDGLEDTHLNEMPDSLEGYNILAPVATYADLPDPAGLSVDDAALVEDEGKYYFVMADPTRAWKYLGEARYEHVEGEGKLKLESHFYPAFYNDYYYEKSVGLKIEASANNKVKLYMGSYVDNVEVGDEVQFKFSSDYDEEAWFEVIAKQDTTQTYWVELDTDYLTDFGSLSRAGGQAGVVIPATLNEIIIRRAKIPHISIKSGVDFPYHVPASSSRLGFIWLKDKEYFPNQPYAAVWFGMGSITIGASTISVPITASAAKTAHPFCLTWEGSAGLVAYWWPQLLDFIGRAKKVTHQIDLSPSELSRIGPDKPFVVDGNSFFPRRIKISFSQSGNGLAKIETWRG